MGPAQFLPSQALAFDSPSVPSGFLEGRLDRQADNQTDNMTVLLFAKISTHCVNVLFSNRVYAVWRYQMQAC